jgi:hypothetical protein
LRCCSDEDRVAVLGEPRPWRNVFSVKGSPRCRRGRYICASVVAGPGGNSAVCSVEGDEGCLRLCRL